MSDPFGKDDADFDIEQMCRDAYGNAVEYMRERAVLALDPMTPQ